MAEIRSFLTEMTIPQLQDSNFATSFNTFCESIKDNINKIVSAPFLKGDRGAHVEVHMEPLMNEDRWTQFAKTLIHTIYGTEYDIEGYPLPLIHDISSDGIIDDNDPRILEVGDGGPIIYTEDGETKICRSYDIFNPDNDNFIENLPVCYDSASGKKYFCVPFYFIDGRLNHLEDLEDERLSLFKDMSCVVWGEGTYIGDESLENMEDPNNWDWNMIQANVTPKLYYNTELGQFCWEINGTQTGILAQGIQGEPGYTPKMWVCMGESDSGTGTNAIKITNIIGSQHGTTLISDILADDFAMVIYDMEGSDSLRKIQFGPVIVNGNNRYIANEQDGEIMRIIRSANLINYLDSIGFNPYPGDIEDTRVCNALYTRERSLSDEPLNTDPIMAIWAGINNQHYIAPLRKSAIIDTSTEEINTSNALADRILNVLYRTIKLYINSNLQTGNIQILGKAIVQTEAPAPGLNSKSYKLAVITNVVETYGNITNRLGRLGQHPNGRISTSVPYSYTWDFSSQYPDIIDQFIYIECETLIGWVESDINLNGGSPNRGIDMYRVQKYPFWLRVPVIQDSLDSSTEIYPTPSDNGLALSINGTTWVKQLTLSNHHGSGDASYTISLTDENNPRAIELVVEKPNREATTTIKYFQNCGLSVNNVSNIHGITKLYADCIRLSGSGHNISKNIPFAIGGSSNYVKLYTQQYRLDGFKLKFSKTIGTTSYTIPNMIWFCSDASLGNTQSGAAITSHDQLNITNIPSLFPLIDDRFSFLSFPLSTNNQSIVTNDTDGYMNRSRVMQTYPSGSATTPSKHNPIYYINTEYYETIYPSESNIYQLTNNNAELRDTYKLNAFPMNSELRIYPEGATGLRYQVKQFGIDVNAAPIG